MLPITGPKQTVIVTCRMSNEIGKSHIDNLITLDWHMLTSNEPPLYAISLGKSRHSLQIIRESKVFCVNYLDEKHKNIAIQCGTISGKHVNKWEKFGIEKEECTSIDCPRIKNAPACIECELLNEIETGDHIIIIGKIIKAHHLKESKRLINLGNKGENKFDGFSYI
jgi:flavin reductase (DIM6/NTAB) family NADH-FMN oxidoreductase RutF